MIQNWEEELAHQGVVLPIQSDLSRLEKQADRNIMQFSKGKCKVLYLERNNPLN